MRIRVPSGVDRSKRYVADRLNNRRFYKKLIRRALLAGEIARSQRHARTLLKALRSPKLRLVQKKKKRSLPAGREKSQAVELKDFSIIDRPIETLAALRTIADLDLEGNPYYVDFLDEKCLDIAPYLLFGLMRQELQTGLCKGGKIEHELQQIISSLNMSRFLKMRYPKPFEPQVIQPFPMIQQSQRLRTAGDHKHEKTRKEDAASRFAVALDGWLQAVNYELSDEGEDNVRALLGEILDNTRHAIKTDENGGDSDWCIAGFLVARKRADGSDQWACHLALISLGRAIYETLHEASFSQPELKRRIEDYCDMHQGVSRVYGRNELITVMSLADRVSCQPPDAQTNAGCGMSTFISLINFIGNSPRTDELPNFTIISGESCLQIKYPFNNMFQHRDDAANLTHFQLFNAEQDAALPPSESHVYKLPLKFPGTVIAVRFFLDRDALDLKYDGKASSEN